MRRKAFTITETLVTMFMVTIIAACCVKLLSVTINKMYDATVERSSQKVLATALLYMSREVRGAKEIDVNADRLTITPVTGEDICYELTEDGLIYNGSVIFNADCSASSFTAVSCGSHDGVKISLTAKTVNETSPASAEMKIYRRCSQ